MNIFVSAALLIVLFYVLAKIVDDYFIKSLDNIAHYLKLSPSVSGATLMAMGTSAPELSTALFALFLVNANPATGVGTIVGSAIFQILVVIGFAALVKTAYLDWRPVLRDGFFYSLSVGMLILFVRDGIFTKLESSILVGGYVVYLIVLFFWLKFVKEKNTVHYVEEKPQVLKDSYNKGLEKGFRYFLQEIKGKLPDPHKNKKWTFPVFVFSLFSIAYISYWLVVLAEGIALDLGISPAIIALTILAGGSSVPEMVGSAIVSRQGRGDMAISNAIGSNIFDIQISLGLPLLIYTFVNGNLETIGDENIVSSVFLLLATLLMVLLLLAAQRFKAGRGFGVFLIVVYVAYVFAAYSGFL